MFKSLTNHHLIEIIRQFINQFFLNLLYLLYFIISITKNLTKVFIHFFVTINSKINFINFVILFIFKKIIWKFLIVKILYFDKLLAIIFF